MSLIQRPRARRPHDQLPPPLQARLLPPVPFFFFPSRSSSIRLLLHPVFSILHHQEALIPIAQNTDLTQPHAPPFPSLFPVDEATKFPTYRQFPYLQLNSLLSKGFHPPFKYNKVRISYYPTISPSQHYSPALMGQTSTPLPHSTAVAGSPLIYDGDGESTANEVASSSKMMSLWKRALESNRALLLDETELSPDSLLERVEEFGGLSMAADHSYPALIISGGGANDTAAETKDTADEAEEDSEYDEEDHDFCEERESPVPFGALPVDFIAERLHRGI